MAWTVALWALAFGGQAALLGAAMYGLVVLSDLEADFVNPHDCAASLNKWIVRCWVVVGERGGRGRPPVFFFFFRPRPPVEWGRGWRSAHHARTAPRGTRATCAAH